MSRAIVSCWICNSPDVRLRRKGNASTALRPELFRITASDYGVTADIYRCSDCGFLFCPNVGDVLEQYARMDDESYEATRSQRSLQARQLLKVIATHKPKGELLDIGAGSGILVEEALKQSFDAVGLEPSAPLSRTAQNLHLPIRTGVLPQQDLLNRFDVVTLIDVIEHVDSPLSLLNNAAACMKADAICAIVTPDVDSLAARIMGKKWWHHRLAHIGYFSQKTIRKALDAAGLDIVSTSRPGWYFPAAYLAERLMQYMPPALRIKTPAVFERITVPLNLFDSLLIIAKKR